MYTTMEPCVMCTGSIYWANIGTIVYAMTERRLLTLTGSDAQNPTFDLPTKEILTHGQKKITVIGPFREVEKQASIVHDGYWIA